MICLCNIVQIFVDISDCCKYVRFVMTNKHEHVTTIFDDSMHAFNVSFRIMRSILFSHLIGENCILYLNLVPIYQVKNV